MPQARVAFFVEHDLDSAKTRREVLAAQVGLQLFGAGSTQLVQDEPKELCLEFSGRFLKSALDPDVPDFQPFGRLKLKCQLRGSPPVIEARFSGDEVIEYDEPLADDPLSRKLSLNFNSNTFKNIPPDEHAVRSLQLPVEKAENKDAAYLEIAVALLVDGSEEAAVELNDVLDIPVRPVNVGLVVEWPSDLDDDVPPGLTLVAVQGDQTRYVRWDQGILEGLHRRFLFRGIVGSAPVDLLAHFEGKEVLLFEKQDVSDQEKAPQWKETLERAIRPSGLPAEGEGQFEAEGSPPEAPVAKTEPKAGVNIGELLA